MRRVYNGDAYLTDKVKDARHRSRLARVYESAGTLSMSLDDDILRYRQHRRGFKTFQPSGYVKESIEQNMAMHNNLLKRSRTRLDCDLNPHVENIWMRMRQKPVNEMANSEIVMKMERLKHALKEVKPNVCTHLSRDEKQHIRAYKNARHPDKKRHKKKKRRKNARRNARGQLQVIEERFEDYEESSEEECEEQETIDEEDCVPQDPQRQKTRTKKEREGEKSSSQLPAITKQKESSANDAGHLTGDTDNKASDRQPQSRAEQEQEATIWSSMIVGSKKPDPGTEAEVEGGEQEAAIWAAMIAGSQGEIPEVGFKQPASAPSVVSAESAPEEIGTSIDESETEEPEPGECQEELTDADRFQQTGRLPRL